MSEEDAKEEAAAEALALERMSTPGPSLGTFYREARGDGMPTTTLGIYPGPRIPIDPERIHPTLDRMQRQNDIPPRTPPNESPTGRQMHEIDPESPEALEAEMRDREEREAIRAQRARHEEIRASLRR